LYFFNNGFFLSSGAVVFDVVINGVTKLDNFDLIGAVAGSPDYGLWREFSNITEQNGAITVRIVPEHGLNYYSATISGIKVTAQ